MWLWRLAKRQNAMDTSEPSILTPTRLIYAAKISYWHKSLMNVRLRRAVQCFWYIFSSLTQLHQAKRTAGTSSLVELPLTSARVSRVSTEHNDTC